MAKFCQNCGSEINEEMNYCNGCGISLKKDSLAKETPKIPPITKRDVAIQIVLSVLTCGLYSFYWFIVMTDDTNKLADNKTASGGTALLYTLLTCGIYGLYWHYQNGKKLYEAGKKYNKEITDNSILYLVLSIFGLAIINYCLVQSDLNKFTTNE